MRTGPVALFVAASWLGGGIGVASAEDAATPRVGETVRITTVQTAERVALKVGGQAADLEATAPAGGDSFAALGSRFPGNLVKIDDDALTVAVHSAENLVRIPRKAIARLEVRKGHSRGWNALVGAGVGASIGLGWP